MRAQLPAIGNANERRRWIVRKRGDTKAITAELYKRLQVFHDKLWAPANPRPFWVLVPRVILGVVPKDSIRPLFIEAIGREEDVRQVQRVVPLALERLWLTLPIFNRIAPDRPRVALTRPVAWAVPAGCIHALDFSPQELGAILDEGIRLHGVAEFRRLTGDLAKRVERAGARLKSLPRLVHVDDRIRVGWNQAEVVQAAVLRRHLAKYPNRTKEWDKAKRTRDRISKLMPRLLQGTVDVLSRVGRGLKVDETIWLRGHLEYMLSVARSAPDIAMQQASAMKLGETVRKAKGPEGMELRSQYRVLLKAMHMPKAKPSYTKAGPDTVYRTYRTYLFVVRRVRAETKEVRNKTEAARIFLERNPKFPPVLLGEMLSYIEAPQIIAARMAASALKMGETSFGQHLKEGRPNGRANDAWKAYLNDPECPFGLPPGYKGPEEAQEYLNILNEADRFDVS